MSFDAWVVGFGLSRVLIELKIIGSPWAYAVMVITIMIDCYLLYLFFTKQRAATLQVRAGMASLTGVGSVPDNARSS